MKMLLLGKFFFQTNFHEIAYQVSNLEENNNAAGNDMMASPNRPLF